MAGRPNWSVLPSFETSNHPGRLFTVKSGHAANLSTSATYSVLELFGMLICAGASSRDRPSIGLANAWRTTTSGPCQRLPSPWSCREHCSNTFLGYCFEILQQTLDHRLVSAQAKPRRFLARAPNNIIYMFLGHTHCSWSVTSYRAPPFACVGIPLGESGCSLVASVATHKTSGLSHPMLRHDAGELMIWVHQAQMGCSSDPSPLRTITSPPSKPAGACCRTPLTIVAR